MLAQRFGLPHVRDTKRRFLSRLKTNLIFPGSHIKYSMEQLEHLYPGASILARTTRQDTHIGLMYQEAIPTIPHDFQTSTIPRYLLFFYGNGMSLATSATLFAFFQQRELHILIPDYQGYGMSSGQASEEGCYATADMAYSYLTETLQIPPAHLLVGGWSLGAAVAIDLVSRQPAAGLLVLSPFTTLLEEARLVLPWLPQHLLEWLMQERFDNVSKIRQITCPILIAHGTRDALIPFVMAERLTQEARASSWVRLLPLEGCDHNNLFTMGRQFLWEGIEHLLSY